MAEKNVIREDVVRISWDVDDSPLSKITGKTKTFKSAVEKMSKATQSGFDKITKSTGNLQKKFATATTKAKALLGAVKKVASENLSTLTNAVSNLTKKMGTGLVKAAKAAASAIAAIGAGAAAALTKGVKYNGLMETYQTSFEVMTGSAKEAQRITSELQKMGAATPFEMTDLADTTQLLMNYGLTANDAMSRMSMLGDIAQGDADKMNRIAMAYGQMSSAGKVALEDVKQMIEAGFNPLNEISTTTGESMASLYDRISKGNISVDEITDSMKRATSKGGKYFQSMEKQSKTFNGQWSTMKDNIDQFLGTLSKGLFDKLSKTIMPKVNDAISGLHDAFQKGGLSGLLKKLGNVGEAFQSIIDKIKGIKKNSKIMSKVNKVFETLKKTLDTTVEFAGFLIEKFIEFATAESTLSVLNGLLETFNDALKWCKKHWELVETAILGVISVSAGLKLTKFITDIDAALFKAGLLKTELSAMQKLSITVGVTLAITGIVTQGKGIVDTINEGLNLNNAGEIAGGAGSLVAGGALIGKTFGATLIGGAIAAIPAGIAALFAGIWDACKSGIDWLSGLLIAGGGTLAGAGIGALIGSIGGPMGALIGLAVGLVIDLVFVVIKYWDQIVAWCSNACQKIGGFFSNLWTSICNGVSSAWASICAFFAPAISWVNTNIIQPVKNFFTNLWYFLVGLAVIIWDSIKAVITPIANWVNTNIIQPVANFFSWLWNKIVSIVTSVKNTICMVWGVIAGWVQANIITPVVNCFTGLWTSITTCVRNVWNTICAVWGLISGWVNTNVISPVKSFFGSLWNTITEKVASVKSTIVSAFTGAFAEVKEVWSKITGFFSGLWDGIKGTVEKIIGKGKEALGVSDKKKPRKHARGGYFTSPHFGVVAEAGPEFIIPTRDKNRGRSLWEKAGRALGMLSTPQLTLPNYSPSGSVSTTNTSNSQTNNYSPQFTLNLSGTVDRTTERTVKQWVKEAIEDTLESMSRTSPRITEA